MLPLLGLAKHGKVDGERGLSATMKKSKLRRYGLIGHPTASQAMA